MLVQHVEQGETAKGRYGCLLVLLICLSSWLLFRNLDDLERFLFETNIDEFFYASTSGWMIIVQVFTFLIWPFVSSFAFLNSIHSTRTERQVSSVGVIIRFVVIVCSLPFVVTMIDLTSHTSIQKDGITTKYLYFFQNKYKWSEGVKVELDYQIIKQKIGGELKPQYVIHFSDGRLIDVGDVVKSYQYRAEAVSYVHDKLLSKNPSIRMNKKCVFSVAESEISVVHRLQKHEQRMLALLCK